MFLVLQAATAAILFTGGNTSFTGFPFLASFVAEDSFLPGLEPGRRIRLRGHGRHRRRRPPRHDQPGVRPARVAALPP
jgi:hypothetical protein